MQNQDEKKYHCQKKRKLRPVSGQGKGSGSLRLPSTRMMVFVRSPLPPPPLPFSFSFSLSSVCVRVGNTGLLAVDESIASPVPESVAAATTAAKPRLSKGGGSCFPVQGEPSRPPTRDLCAGCLEKDRWGARRRGWAHQRSPLVETAIRRLAISTADSAKLRRRRQRDGREANLEAAKLSYWMVGAEKGE